MAKLTIGNGAEYISQLKNLEFSAPDCIKKAVYPAAGLVVKAVDHAIDALPEVSHPGDGVTPLQKKGLHEGLGIADFKNDSGYINVKIGFDGYNDLKTKKHPQGQANAMIARAMESGTSYSRKHPFVSTATRGAKAEAEDILEKTLNEEIAKIMEV